MNEKLEALIAENRRTAITSGCCGTPAWRGRLCQYHNGVEDGIHMAQKILDESH
jgi:hypothetical protein